MTEQWFLSSKLTGLIIKDPQHMLRVFCGERKINRFLLNVIICYDVKKLFLNYRTAHYERSNY